MNDDDYQEHPILYCLLLIPIGLLVTVCWVLQRTYHHKYAILLFAVLTIIATWPLALNLGGSLYSPTDHVSTDIYASIWNHFYWPALAYKHGGDPRITQALCAPCGYWISFYLVGLLTGPVVSLFIDPAPSLVKRDDMWPYGSKDFDNYGRDYAKCNRCKALYIFVNCHYTHYSKWEALSPLCNACWKFLGTPSKRLPYYQTVFLTWRQTEENGQAWLKIHKAVMGGN